MLRNRNRGNVYPIVPTQECSQPQKNTRTFRIITDLHSYMHMKSHLQINKKLKSGLLPYLPNLTSPNHTSHIRRTPLHQTTDHRVTLIFFDNGITCEISLMCFRTISIVTDTTCQNQSVFVPTCMPHTSFQLNSSRSQTQSNYGHRFNMKKKYDCVLPRISNLSSTITVFRWWSAVTVGVARWSDPWNRKVYIDSCHVLYSTHELHGDVRNLKTNY
jgi:hypothetical protein